MYRKSSLFIVSIFLIFVSCSHPNKEKEITTYVFDKEHILTESQIKQFDSLFSDHEKRTGNEIALVTTPDFKEDGSILNYAVNFGQKHGVGRKNTDNGVVIAFCNSKRKTCIATGYGTETVLKDEIANRIIDSLMLPQFKDGNLFEGLWAGSKAVTDFLEKPENKIIKNAKKYNR